MRRPCVAYALLFLTIGCGDALAPTTQNDPVASAAEIRTAANMITPAKALGWLAVITDDSMGGRNTPSIGLEKTAQYLADNYHAWEMLPAGENSGWFQRYTLQATQTNAPNVVAMVRGSDPVLRDEYVIFSSHMDHLGTVGDGVGGCSPFTRPDGTIDRICNGADDNGSGTVAVLSIAQAVASLNGRTRRSIVVLNVSGEEKGLLGSAYYADHPTLPLGNVVADINLDMISHNSPDSIVVIGKEHSDMGVTLARVQAAHPELKLIGSDDIWPTENFYSRSDHYNFARKGVPVLFFFNGTHPQYHRADDEVKLINGSKLARVAQLAFYLGVEIANSTAKPQWNPASYQTIVVEHKVPPVVVKKP